MLTPSGTVHNTVVSLLKPRLARDAEMKIGYLKERPFYSKKTDYEQLIVMYMRLVNEKLVLLL